MRSRFDEQLMQLNTELIQMGALCEDAISTAIYSLMEGDTLISNSSPADRT